MIIKKNIKKILIRLIKNKYLTYFVAIFTLFFINESLNNSETLNIFNLLMSNKAIKLILFLIILVIGYYNLGLGLLLFINLYFVINIKKNIENFSNVFPNLIDKNEVLKYNKYIKNDLNKEKKEVKKNNNEAKRDKIIDKKEEPNENNIKMDFEVRKEKLLEELKEIEKHEEKERNSTIESDLDDKYETTKKNLELLESTKNEDNEDEEISSTDSSSSNVSSSDSSSTDSEQEYKNVSMKKARKHVLGKIKNKIKKKYINED